MSNTNIRFAKILPIEANTADGFDALTQFLALAATTYNSAAWKANRFRESRNGDELFESISGLSLSTRTVVTGLARNTVTGKRFVPLSGQVIQPCIAGAAVQFGQILEQTAGGAVSPSNAAGEDVVGAAMNNAAAPGDVVWVCRSGIWFAQFDAGLTELNVDCASDGAGKLIEGASADVVIARRITTSSFTVDTRTVSLFQFYNPMTLP
jgi:hypothetical protein